MGTAEAGIRSAAGPSAVSVGRTGWELPAQAERHTVPAEWTETGIHIRWPDSVGIEAAVESAVGVVAAAPAGPAAAVAGVAVNTRFVEGVGIEVDSLVGSEVVVVPGNCCTSL